MASTASINSRFGHRGCRSLLITFSFVFLSLCLLPTQLLAGENSTDVSTSIDEILSAVQTALSDTQAYLYNNKMPPLKDVSLELQAVFSASGDAGFNLYVISADGKLTSENTQKIVIALAPPNPEQTAPAAAPKVIARALTEGLMQAARGVQAAATRKPPLRVKSLKVDLEFVVSREGSVDAGWKFAIIPIDLKLSGTVTSGTVQHISVEFGY
jgi:hypothetical protein